MKILRKCPTCHKTAVTKSEMKVGTLTIRTYECGHIETGLNVAAAQEDTLDITSIDGKRPFNFQLAGARFVEGGNGRVLIADEMALGKTVQFLMFVIAHPEVRPFAVFVKAGLKLQWFKEAVRWGDLMCQVLDGTQDRVCKGFDGYIISYDSAWRMGHKIVKTKAPGQKKATITYEPIPGQTLPEQLEKVGVKTIGLDECQQIKNADSNRTKAIQNVCRLESIQHVIALSGTPIKNNAAEYFPVLNMLRPDKFPNKNQFVYGWCDTYMSNGYPKIGGIRDIKKFMEYTKDFIIRRTRAEVLPDLPSVFRQFTFVELGEMVEEEYKKTVRDFLDLYGEDPADTMNLLAYLSKMRHLTGLSKIDPVCSFVEEFITSTDRKLAIFVHHKDVGATLAYKLGQMAKEWPAEWGKGILQLTSDMDSQAREEMIDQWRSPDYRICVLSTLASGEGLNLQFCSDCVMMERQWNPANEEQAEGRFPRPGQAADKINANYFVATGTVDEFFADLVEKKREIVGKTLDGKAVQWNETTLMKELMAIIAQRGGKKWGW